MIIENKTVTTAQLCEYFGVSREMIRKWRNQGMPYKQYNARVMEYDFNKVVAWKSRQKPKPMGRPRKRA